MPEARKSPSLATNIVSNWLWYLLVLASGFVIPRLISDHQSLELLGVWDFGWTMVFWIRWMHFGITASINRYVARYRAIEDWPALNATVNTSLGILLIGGVVGLFLTLGFTWAVPRLLENKAASDVISTARWVVFLLCTTAAIQVPGGVFNAVITGYERFDLLNHIRIIKDAVVLVANVWMALTGYSVASMAASVLVGEALGEICKYFLARRLSPQLRISARHCTRQAAREMVAFGGKTVMQGFASGSLYSFNKLLATHFLGIAPLAVLTRQLSLATHTMRFVKQYAQVFIPATSALEASGKTEQVRRLLIQSSRFGLCVALPLMLLLLILGEQIIQIWMGKKEYYDPGVMTVVALGHLLFVPQLSVYSILMGINRHGRVAIFDTLACALSVLLGWLLMGPLEMGILGAAISVSLPLAVSGGIIMPVYACRLLDLPIRRYVAEVIAVPALAAIPFSMCLLLSRSLFEPNAARTLTVGLASGGAITALIYWRWVLPQSARTKIMQKLRLARPA